MLLKNSCICLLKVLQYSKTNMLKHFIIINNEIKLFYMLLPSIFKDNSTIFFSCDDLNVKGDFCSLRVL